MQHGAATFGGKSRRSRDSAVLSSHRCASLMVQVQTWMEGLFGQESVPDYEIRSDTLDALVRLMKRHERSCLINSELRADAERKKQEYEGEGTTSLSIA